MDNPYQASNRNDQPVSEGSITSASYEALAATRPWVKLCSVAGFISVCFLMIGSISRFSKAPRSAGVAEMAEIMADAIVPLVLALLFFLPSLRMWKFGSAISRLLTSRSTRDLEDALIQQKRFWRLVGIMMMISVILMILVSVTAIGG